MAQMTNLEGNWLGGSGRLLEEVGFQKDKPRRMGGLDRGGRRETRPGCEEGALWSRMKRTCRSRGERGVNELGWTTSLVGSWKQGQRGGLEPACSLDI